MRRDEVLTLRWDRVDMDTLTFRVEETKTDVPLELPITSQLAAILERRSSAAEHRPEGAREWVFQSPTSATGHVQDPHHLYARIGKAGGAKFWFHGLRNSFITAAERELMLPPRSPSGWSITPCLTMSPKDTPPTGQSRSFAIPPRISLITSMH